MYNVVMRNNIDKHFSSFEFKKIKEKLRNFIFFRFSPKKAPALLRKLWQKFTSSPLFFFFKSTGSNVYCILQSMASTLKSQSVCLCVRLSDKYQSRELNYQIIKIIILFDFLFLSILLILKSSPNRIYNQFCTSTINSYNVHLSFSLSVHNTKFP